MITVVIPVLNESETVSSVIAFVRSDPNVADVIVVDDGSIDGTPEVPAQDGRTHCGTEHGPPPTKTWTRSPHFDNTIAAIFSGVA
jgi:GT2 family glycosyltransferase